MKSRALIQSRNSDRGIAIATEMKPVHGHHGAYKSALALPSGAAPSLADASRTVQRKDSMTENRAS
ncbi:hypothetical protein [Paenarthrobacter nitroguajacolicus]|uniref:hypothetical protein n=1 Tax=Paenarthrobacter nitroguajacolicus TaxID=211146 RepID=UPI00248C7E40|nr:hypothetical protein [Paenarthrobacter nitroguajacolicus]MDI2037293.1 hypothetical protein [Paenarthrobacter nitroguajacolicus]